MTKRRWMPFYIADYLADTGHLSTVEHGAYLLLIMHYWQNGGLPNDDTRLARIARLQPSEWAEARVSIVDLFGDGWTHKRVDAELAHSDRVMEQRSDAARASAEARRSKRDPNDERTLNERSPSDQTKPYVSVSVSESQQSQDSGQEGSARGNEAGARLEFSTSFWPAYPNKVGRPKAISAFIAARRRAGLDEIMGGLDRYIRQKPPDRSWMNPATFLNQDRWNDEPASVSTREANSGGGEKRSSAEVSASAMGRVLARRHGHGERQAGPDGRQEPDGRTIAVDYREVERTSGGFSH